MADNRNIDSSLLKRDGASQTVKKQVDGFSKSNFDTKDKKNEKSRSLMNINLKVCDEKAKNSTSENSLTKLPLTNLPVVFLNLYLVTNLSEKKFMGTK
ncbi:hypothetical protein TNCT_318801 [Trichonephila clavata]|uniref:Uncharacterized protein n=1 Tax=Trichonephila clavata TaxID=2740835 RepID=A0A8X6JE47_TRICU|nr:hypothetical protein TNCT_318801 [Trichonephila clavata]